MSEAYPPEDEEFTIDDIPPLAVSVTQEGYYCCGVQQTSATTSQPSAHVKQPFYAQLSPPSIAAFGVAVMTGFELAYQNTDHWVKIELVEIDPLPLPGSGEPVPNGVTGYMQLGDKSLDRPWTGTVYITVIYFAPYWA